MGSDEKTELIGTLRRIAAELGTDSVSRTDFLRRSGLSERKIQLLFGGYNGLVEAAGLVPRRFPSSEVPTYSDEDMLDELVRVLRLPSSKLTVVFFEQNSNISPSACQRRFGGWINALKAAAARLDPARDGVLLSRIQEYTAPALPPPSRSVEQATEPDAFSDAEDHSASHVVAEGRIPPAARGNLYGDFINFRGLQHAPLNEQGVVFLFGMICRELGYVVEIVKPGFPDCEAKREVRPGVWQRVRIEFEFRSRTFYSHGHDPDQCDVIVCWEDNWPNCPIEVLELKSALARLPSTVRPR
jgi:hypothetical protein